jgi:signal peptidase I
LNEEPNQPKSTEAPAEEHAAGPVSAAPNPPASAPKPPPQSGARVFRAAYWAAWFVFVPFVLATVLVWALTPPSGVDRAGVIGWVQGFVREQPVPVGIVAFTIFEMLVAAARHHLPLARYAYPPLRTDLPAKSRTAYERARALLEEAETILTRNETEIGRELTVKERDKLRADLDALEETMSRAVFDEEAFYNALVQADGEVDVRLGRWRKSEVREYLESIAIAIAVALALRAFVVEAFKIPSGSMIPTLQVGDHIFVNKFTYGPAIPWTKARVWTHMPPKRGDVIVFAFPEHPEQDFIKRVIAIPGDVLEARSGHPWINGWEVPHCYVGVYTYEASDEAMPHHEGDLYVEFLEDEAYLAFYDRASGAYPERQGPYVAKPGEVWVMGDNRNNSHDSRMWWQGQGGGVPFDNIKGRALFVWLSVSDAGIDWSRLGAPVMGRPRLPPSQRALESGVSRCLKDRPPLDKTVPPPRQK